jgi:hypothetical protein
MVIRTETSLPLLLFLLVSMSAVATLPQVQSTWEGVREVYTEQDFGLRLLREAMLIVIVAYVALERRFWNTVLSSKLLAMLMLLASYVVFEVAYALHLGLPLIVPLTGLRLFQYLPLALVGLMVARMPTGEQIVLRFASYLRYYVLVQAALAVAQALWAPPLHGVSMLGSGRPFGTFVSPNLFGVTMATCALVFALTGKREARKWVYLSTLLALLSGSRTAVFGALLVVTYQAYYALRPRDRWLIALPAPLLAVGVLVFASSELISGREINLAEEGRIVLWRETLAANVTGPLALLFGWGLGLGSNTINILFGTHYFPGQFDSDSLYLFMLNGYGLCGLIAYLGVLLLSYNVSRHPQKALVLTYILVSGLAFNFWEYFPQNALLMLLWGLMVGAPAPASTLYSQLIPGGEVDTVDRAS